MFVDVILYNFQGNQVARKFPCWPGQIMCSPEACNYFQSPEYFQIKLNFLILMGIFMNFDT